MIRFSFAAALSLCVPFVTPVTAQTDTERSRLIAAIEAAGCIGTEANGEALLAAAGLTEDVAEPIAMQLIAEGALVEEADTLRLTINSCAGAANAPDRTGLLAATTWMDAVSDIQAAGVLAEVMTARGCSVLREEFEGFTEEVGRAVAGRFDVDLPTPLPAQNDPTFGEFVGALDQMGDRGGSQLFSSGSIELIGNRSRLIDCTVPGGAPGGAPEGAAEADRLLGLREAVLSIDRETIEVSEANALRSLGCEIPADMGFALQAFVLDSVLIYVGIDSNIALAVEVMAGYRVGEPYIGFNADNLNYAAQIVAEVSDTRLSDGRVTVEGDLWVAVDCEAESNLQRLFPYLTGAL